MNLDEANDIHNHHQVADFEGDLDIADTDYLEGQSGQSKLRIQNASLDGEDKRYAGKKTSRKALQSILIVNKAFSKAKGLPKSLKDQ